MSTESPDMLETNDYPNVVVNKSTEAKTMSDRYKLDGLHVIDTHKLDSRYSSTRVNLKEIVSRLNALHKRVIELEAEVKAMSICKVCAGNGSIRSDHLGIEDYYSCHACGGKGVKNNE